MAAAAEQSTAKAALLVALGKTFSADLKERRQAEEKLRILETISEFGTFLVEITIDKTIPLPTRQLAAVVLGHYVASHWSSDAEKFTSPEVEPNIKALIRNALPQGLVDESNKIRLSVAHVVSQIVRFDWPEEWPEIFTLLVQLLHSGNVNAVHGAMRVLAEFVDDVTDLQIPHLAPVILPELLNVFVQDKVFSIRTRSRAVQIFATIAGLISLMKEVYKSAAKDLLFPSLSNFVQAFTTQLSMPYGETSDCGLKMEVIQALVVLLKGFPKAMAKYLPGLLPPVWEVFTSNVDEYSAVVVNAFEEKEDIVDEDGEVLNFENLIFAVFEFITALIEVRRFQTVIAGHLEAILLHTMVYMQMTEDQVINWALDPSQFVEDEDEETFSYSIRISAQNLILSLCEKFGENGVTCLLNAITALTKQGIDAREAKNNKWWKFSEVSFLCLGYVHETVSANVASGKAQFDLKGYLTTHVLEACGCASELPFLGGQALWCASRYVTELPESAIDQFLSLSVVALHQSLQPVLQVFAIKSLYSFCQHLKEANAPGLNEKHLPGIVSGLAAICGSFSGNALTICLETVSIACKVDPQQTAPHLISCNLVPTILNLFMRHCTDPFLSDILMDLIGTLFEIPSCAQIVMNEFVPTVIGVMSSASDQNAVALLPPCLDVLTSIIRHCPPPLPSDLVTKALPAVVRCVLQSDDNAVIQNGGETVRALFSCDSEAVMAWRDGSGVDGLSYVVQVLAFLLDPRSSEFTASFAGKLIFVLVSKAGGRLGENLHLILRAVLSKLQQCNTMTVAQALLMVFIQLLRYEMQTTLEFLSSVPGPMGQSAFDYIFTQWCTKQPTFFGSYDIRVSCITMKDLLVYAVKSGDKRFQELLVPGDEIETGEGIQTRRKSKEAGPARWTQIPVAIKLFKLLLNELKNQLEEQEDLAGSDADDDYEDDDDDEPGLSEQGRSIVDALLAPAGDFNGFDYFEDEEDDDSCDDADQKQDPINVLNLREVLSEFVREFSQQNFFPTFTEALTPAESNCLRQLEILSK